MKMTSCGFLLLMGLVASIALVREAGAQGITFQTTDLTLVTGTGRHYFTVYVANNNVSQTARGPALSTRDPPERGLTDLAIASSSRPDQCFHGWPSAAGRPSVYCGQRHGHGSTLLHSNRLRYADHFDEFGLGGARVGLWFSNPLRNPGGRSSDRWWYQSAALRECPRACWNYRPNLKSDIYCAAKLVMDRHGHSQRTLVSIGTTRSVLAPP